MFHCSVCGSDDVRERDVSQLAEPPDESDPDRGRLAARACLNGAIVVGAALVIIGVLISTATTAAAERFITGSDAFVIAAGYVLATAGICSVMLGIIGHGVRLGIDSASRGAVSAKPTRGT